MPFRACRLMLRGTGLTIGHERDESGWRQLLAAGGPVGPGW